MSQPPLLVVGMHRSGTSLLARMLQQRGLHLGDDLVPADQHNPDGYGEDKRFVAFHRHILSQATPPAPEAWLDWGWSSAGAFHCADPHAAPWLRALRPAAEGLLERSRREQPWGWKDPRTTLLLPFWEALEPEAWVIGIYRHPWEIVDALQRLRPPVFLTNPHWALPIWLHYNQALLERWQRHPQRTVLLNSGALIAQPAALGSVLARRLGWAWSAHAGEQLAALRRPDLHRSPPTADALPLLHRLVSPESTALLEALERSADLPVGLPPLQPERLAVLQAQPAASPRLAVVIPTFNQGDLLVEAVASVEREAARSGCAPSLELQIVDDGSNQSRSLQVLDRLQALGYRVLSQRNHGLSAARNAGIRATTAPLLLPLDDDNRLLAPYLSQGLAWLERQPNLAVVYGDRQEFGLREGLVCVGVDAPRALLLQSRIDACALLRREWWQAAGGYDQGLTAFEDWDLWLGILRQGGRFGYLPGPAFCYRVRPNSMLQRHLIRQSQASDQLCKIRIKALEQ
ncbi:glycosyltransferase [Synechococcus sp. CBW1108]|uniref:glycosyltransferase n=1 Tax=Synechococcus sp. CBW1108 TaxID=1353147 RepID=UPI0018CF1E16|nr:glycosyltransferase [Synechococcus sp. CBW1108]QPN71481.1 glycosyltransferase [Synechococcus sp. CBW1108]